MGWVLLYAMGAKKTVVYTAIHFVLIGRSEKSGVFSNSTPNAPSGSSRLDGIEENGQGVKRMLYMMTRLALRLKTYNNAVQ